MRASTPLGSRAVSRARLGGHKRFLVDVTTLDGATVTGTLSELGQHALPPWVRVVSDSHNPTRIFKLPLHILMVVNCPDDVSFIDPRSSSLAPPDQGSVGGRLYSQV